MWEYKIIKSFNKDPEDLLKENDNEGWELVSVAFSSLGSYRELYFKRKKETIIL